MLVMHSINVVRRNRRLQTCGDFHHYYSLEEPLFGLQRLCSKRYQLSFLQRCAAFVAQRFFVGYALVQVRAPPFGLRV